MRQKKNGADIVKFQTYKAEKLSIKESPQFKILSGKVVKKGALFNSYKKVDKFEIKEYKFLKKICDKYKIQFMSTPFDEDVVDELYKLGVKRFKIAGFESTDL